MGEYGTQLGGQRRAGELKLRLGSLSAHMLLRNLFLIASLHALQTHGGRTCHGCPALGLNKLHLQLGKLVTSPPQLSGRLGQATLNVGQTRRRTSQFLLKLEYTTALSTDFSVVLLLLRCKPGLLLL